MCCKSSRHIPVREVSKFDVHCEKDFQVFYKRVSDFITTRLSLGSLGKKRNDDSFACVCSSSIINVMFQRAKAGANQASLDLPEIRKPHKGNDAEKYLPFTFEVIDHLKKASTKVSSFFKFQSEKHNERLLQQVEA